MAGRSQHSTSAVDPNPHNRRQTTVTGFARTLSAMLQMECGWGLSVPFFLRMRRILLPVTWATWATPCESRRLTPIWEGVRPFFASLHTCSITSPGVCLNHDGGVRRYGRADFEIPFLQGEGVAGSVHAH